MAASVDSLVSIKETAKDHLKISRVTLHKIVRSGQLQPVKIGGRRFFRTSDLNRYIAGLERAAI
jgi:excisionase family DNA binding protein